MNSTYGKGCDVKLYQHVLIISVLITLIVMLYNKGYGAIPFLLAGLYLGYFCLKEIKYYKKSKRM